MKEYTSMGYQVLGGGGDGWCEELSLILVSLWAASLLLYLHCIIHSASPILRGEGKNWGLRGFVFDSDATISSTQTKQIAQNLNEKYIEAYQSFVLFL